MTKTIRNSCYLIAEMGERHGRDALLISRIVKNTERLPRLDQGEVPLLVDIELPTALFKRPELRVEIKVDDVPTRLEVSAETLDDLTQRASEILGVGVHVTCDVPGADDGS